MEALSQYTNLSNSVQIKSNAVRNNANASSKIIKTVKTVE